MRLHIIDTSGGILDESIEAIRQQFRVGDIVACFDLEVHGALLLADEAAIAEYPLRSRAVGTAFAPVAMFIAAKASTPGLTEIVLYSDMLFQEGTDIVYEMLTSPLLTAINLVLVPLPNGTDMHPETSAVIEKLTGLNGITTRKLNALPITGKLKSMLAYLEKQVAARDSLMEKFQQRLKDDPVGAFSWSQAVMSQTARAAVAQTYLNAINNTWATQDAGADDFVSADAYFDRIIADATQHAMTGARHPERTTCPMSNFMAAERIAAFAEIVQDAKFGF